MSDIGKLNNYLDVILTNLRKCVLQHKMQTVSYNEVIFDMYSYKST